MPTVPKNLLRIAACAAAGLLAPEPPGQLVIHRISGAAEGDHFGWSVSDAGDVDGDGCIDFVVGAPFEDVGPDAGRAHVFSGRTGAPLLVLDGTSAGEQFGYAVSGAGDVNGDGFADVIVGAPGRGGTGSAVVFSGADGSVLFTFNGLATGDRFGASVACAGDVNADGTPDVVVGAPGDDFDPQGAGSAVVFSGVDGAVLFSFGSGATRDGFGRSVSGAGDVDLDGHDDVIVGAPYDDLQLTDAGCAHVFSGQTGLELHAFFGATADAHLGWAVSGAGDVDLDGHGDVIVGARFEFDRGRAQVFSGIDGSQHHVYWGLERGIWFGASVSGAGDVDGDGHADTIMGVPIDGAVHGHPLTNPVLGGVRVLSGRDGIVLHEIPGQSDVGWFGWSVSGVDDVDGDGFDDFLVGEPFGDVRRGVVYLMSGAAVSFSTNGRTLSVSSGGTQTMTLAARAHAGKSYWVLGTVSGTLPGTPLGALVLPLNFDAYTAQTLLAPNAPPLSTSAGTLGAGGVATARFTIPAGLPPAVLGLTLHHACLVFDQSGALVSNAVPVTLGQ